jgi:hypothetical protein
MEESLGRRLAGSLIAAAVGLAMLAGLLLLPDLTPDDAIPVIGQESLHGRIVESLGTDAAGLPLFLVEVLDGPTAGERIEAAVQGAGAALPGSDDRAAYEVGDEVVVARYTGPAGGASFIAEPWRVPTLWILAGVFAAVVLLVGAALFIGSFMTLMRIHPGFDPDRVLTVQISPRFEPAQRPNYGPQFQDIVDRLSQAPGVVHASIISGGMPLGGSMSITTMTVPGGAKVIIINESAAKKYFPGERPVGRTVRMNGEDWAVVGVVGDVYQRSLETAPRTEAYTPMTQSQVIFGELVIRTRNDPYEVLPAVKSAVLTVLPDVPLRNVRTMDELIGRIVAQRKLNMLLLGLFGLLGLVISAVGIYGVMAYVVSQRTREIGVRMALGATRATVVRMVLTKAIVMLAIGLAVGTGAAWLLRSSADAFLFRIESSDLRVFVVAIGTLAVAALVASLVPARRASRVDPMVALRAD